MDTVTVRRSTQIQAVKVAGGGDHFCPEQQHTIISIPSDHAIFDAGESSAVSKLVGVPLLIMSFRPSLLKKRYALKHLPDQYSDALVGNYYENGTAAKLMMRCATDQPRVPQFTAPREWQGRVGAVLVARADKAPLYPHHIEVMLCFVARVDCYERDEMKVGFGAEGRIVTDTDVIGKLTACGFRDYYAEVRIRSSWQADDAEPEEAAWLNGPAPFFQPVLSARYGRLWAASLAQRPEHAKRGRASLSWLSA